MEDSRRIKNEGEKSAVSKRAQTRQWKQIRREEGREISTEIKTQIKITQK